MKGRYAGCSMTIYGTIMPGAAKIAQLANKIQGLTKKAKERLKIIDWHSAHGQNQSLTARRFSINREALREWLKRLKQLGPVGLNDKSHRPHKFRESKLSWQVKTRILEIRKENPTWSKYIIAAIINSDGRQITNPSAVGRFLKKKGLINQKIAKRNQRAATNPKRRFPRDLVIKRPGDMVQIDTKFLVGIGGVKLFQFTAIDVLTKVRVLWVSSSLCSKQGAKFLQLCREKFPFKIQAIQTDNGHEFLKYFDDLCQKKKIPHFYIEPRNPKQNSYVERSHLTDENEFYQQGNMRSSISLLLPLIRKWEHKYNNTRPHQSLNYLTPMAYFNNYQKGRIPTKDFIPLQT